PAAPPAREDASSAEPDRPAHVPITVFWHAPSARDTARRTGARVWVYSRARATIARRIGLEPHVFRLGDELPGGIAAWPAQRRSEVLFWLASHRALVAGDVILGADDGAGARLCPDSWLPRGTTAKDLAQSLQPLLELPV